jgi:hypothetical protein
MAAGSLSPSTLIQRTLTQGDRRLRMKSSKSVMARVSTRSGE